jgi:hypothetical protein
MIEESESTSSGNRGLSSETIRKNFRRPQKERHLGLKIGVIISLLLFSWFISTLLNQKSNFASPPIILNDSVGVGTKDESDDKPGKSDQPDVKLNKSIYVKARNKDDLRKKLLTISETLMQNKEYTPVNASLNIRTYRFSCELLKKPSPYIKLSLVFGPQTTGCEACDNVLIKNPGSNVLAKAQDSDLIYNVIAVAN